VRRPYVFLMKCGLSPQQATVMDPNRIYGKASAILKVLSIDPSGSPYWTRTDTFTVSFASNLKGQGPSLYDMLRPRTAH